jgi:hypothetical protein
MSTPYFGRSWRVTIQLQATGETWTIPDGAAGEPLKCAFEIEQYANASWWFADISVFNFARSYAQSSGSKSGVVQQGDVVTLSAGYQSPASGVIFTGTVLQPIWERSSDTDFKFTLHCVVGMFEDQYGQVNTTIAAGQTQADAVRQVANACAKPIPIEYLDPALENKRYPRGIAVSAVAREFFDVIAVDNEMQMWIGPKGLHIGPLATDYSTPDVVYAPPFSGSASQSGPTKYTLIGTPRQTELGLTFRVLLDSDVQLKSLVQVTNAVANRVRYEPNRFPPIFNPDGVFNVAGLRHIGDTRGNDWYTEITAVTPNRAKIQANNFSYGG